MRSDWPRNTAPMQEANRRRWIKARIDKARAVLNSPEVQKYLTEYEPFAPELATPIRITNSLNNPDYRCQEPSCPDFGSTDFGEGTCPAEHAIPR